MAIPYLSLPVGGGLMLIRFLQLLVDDFKRLRNRHDMMEPSSAEERGKK